MYRTTLSDIDELLNRVRSRISKDYIFEAIKSYRALANRAALISTWIAVSYDIIEKIRELAEQGDAGAKKYIKDLDNAIGNQNITKLQKIEENLLDEACEKFSFINKQECESLTRLKKDRNLCAHPAFTDDNILYQPTSELVRMYIVHAMQFLLIHQPVQGKNMIDRIALDLKRESFPNNIEETHDFLYEKYLKRAKESAIVNLTKVIAKVLIKKDIDYLGKEQKLINTLKVISKTHPNTYENVIKSLFSKIVDTLEDDDLFLIFKMLQSNNESWTWLSSDAKIRLKNVLNEKIKENSDDLVKYHFLEQISITDLKDIKYLVLSKIEDIFLHKIYIYSEVSSYYLARKRGEDIVIFAEYFKPIHIERLIHAFENNRNHQIKDADGSVSIWIQIFDKSFHTVTEMLEHWQRLSDMLKSDENDADRYSSLIKRIDNQANQL